MTLPYCSHSSFTSQVELVEPQAEPTHDHMSFLETELHKYHLSFLETELQKYRARTLFVTMRNFLYKISKIREWRFPFALVCGLFLLQWISSIRANF
jgi:hypothetical protein